ncbi:peptidase P60 [Mangrovactinospora gilvigrisea]|uniref:Peptidase P60 n=1 Tax=Mangrovactinospora gilvigrisea TaxID=1428644 RepID=A0A1J7BE07_9ACTN|nr:bifunctional lytic transglycosylase/C40 family peptidase [Mangrovactinospora gilvigrisea]OIV36907.1 peptidase P60 [Mangrovactinospora gilvigrisea]
MRRSVAVPVVVIGLVLGFVAFLVVGVFVAAGSILGRSGGGDLSDTGLASRTVPAQYRDLIERWGHLCNTLSPAILAAQLYQESGFSPTARSGAGAQGIAQFMPATWAVYGMDANHDGKADIWDPQDAIPSAARYDCALASSTKKVAGDPVDNMLAGYNAGAYRVISSDGVPAISETQNYVQRIRTLAKGFAAPVSGKGNPLPQQVAFSNQAAGAIYYAQNKLGTPYLWGGTGSSAQGGRFDCSGLTQAAYASVGITLPRVANAQWFAGPHPSQDQLQPGDLVFFSKDPNNPIAIHHVGIYVGGGWMIDAPHTGAVIRFDKVSAEGDYFGATRVTAQGAAALPKTAADGSVQAGGGQPAAGG